ncbi:MAG: GNAT family N-acetyltransferase [Salinarimonadaceae bacterium]|nr:MAG: GNAT family N-acetyltransferase [Salinarimonadaceae bacterium]
MAMTLPTVTLRPYLPADAEAVAEIFREAVMTLTGEDYSQTQQEAWAASADNEAAFGKQLEGYLTLIASIDGEPAGFASLKDGTHVEMLYVHPASANMGVGGALIDALEKLAGARGAKDLTVDASETALLFFEARGYEPQKRNTVIRNGEWLSNTTMKKTLGEAPPRKAHS